MILDRYMMSDFSHPVHSYTIRFFGASSQYQAISQHENSSKNSILTTRTLENYSKSRNYGEHDLSDEIASPGS